MYCRFCGAENSNDFRFCGACGKPLPQPKPRLNVWRCAAGAALILCALLSCLLAGSPAQTDTRFASALGFFPTAEEVAALSALATFLTAIPDLCYFVASALALFAGVTLLRRGTDATRAVRICAAAQCLSVVCTGVCNLLAACFPRLLLSLFTDESAVLAAGEHLVATEPWVLHSFQSAFWLHMVFSLALLALCLVLLHRKKQPGGSLTAGTARVPVLGSVLMIFSLAILSNISGALSAAQGAVFGQTAFAALTAASGLFSQFYRPVALLAFLLVLGASVLFTQVKRWIPAATLGVLLAILASVALCSCGTLVQQAGLPAEVMSLTRSSLIGTIVGCAALLLALFFWFRAVSERRLPVWLQIVFPLLLPVLYTLLGTIAVALHPSLPIALLGAALLTALTALLPRRKPQPEGTTPSGT